MKQTFITTVASAMLGVAMTVYAVGDALAGKAKAEQCVSCHMTDGNSVVPVYPKLAGQHIEYLVNAMKAYRDKSRNDPTMLTIAEGYFKTDVDIVDMATFFALQKSNACTETTETDKIKAGSTKIKACSECHRADGNSKNPIFPKLAGQHEIYLINSMKAYQNKTRKHEQMSQMALLFGDDTDIESIAAYFASQKSDTCFPYSHTSLDSSLKEVKGVFE